MRAAFGNLLHRGANWRAAVVAGSLATYSLAHTEPTTHSTAAAEVTTVVQVRELASENPTRSYAVHLEGSVWWTRPAQGRLVLQDETGVAELEMDLHGQPVAVRERVRIEGEGTITRIRGRLRLGAVGAVVENDGTHSMVEKSGAVFLEAGWQPIRLDWFNGAEKSGLEVLYEGPGIPLQRIPDAALRRTQSANEIAASHLAPGLGYRCYEGDWELLPDFKALNPVKTGTTANFDLTVSSRAERAGLRFDGLLNVPRRGLYIFHTRSDDGSRLWVGQPNFSLTRLGSGSLPEPRQLIIGQPVSEPDDCVWTQVQGQVTFAREQAGGLDLEINAGIATLQVEIGDATGLSPERLANRLIAATGCSRSGRTTDGREVLSLLLVPGAAEIAEIQDVPGSELTRTNDSPRRTLTSAAEVHTLKREEAQRGYVARIKGVVTCLLPEHQAFTVQDATSGLYVVDSSLSRSVPPQLGEYLEVEGTTDPGLFAPLVNARSVRSLGLGHFPEPVKPAWDQLMNGSLDAQYCEIEGVVLDWETNSLRLRTHGGLLNAELRLNRADSETLRSCQDAVVRIRGCLFASWDYLTHHLKVGEVRIYGADVVIVQPAPKDLFGSPRKSAEDLLLFDPRASEFQRVRVSGQIVYSRARELFLMDGNRGVRLIPLKPETPAPGAFVDAVGFHDLSGAWPRLNDAVVRTIGHGPLPPPRQLGPGDLLRAENDSTRVRIEGLLVNARTESGEQVLEVQSGLRSFLARLKVAPKDVVSTMAVGSRLDLTGVYVAEGGNRLGTRDVASFELLLSAPADIKILSRPPWWTFKRLLIIVGALGCVLVLAVLWLTQLHREVELRTAQLETQIQERQRVEQQRALEQERTRVAQDLHDELGSGLTEITMLAARAASSSAPQEKRLGYLDQTGNKARELVEALDEIVWAMNPRHDSLASLISYFCLYAERFLGLANIAWHLDGPTIPPDRTLDGRQRHQLFLAFKEALTNVVRHSGATEVGLSIRFEPAGLKLIITDNGHGITLNDPANDMDGIINMRQRIEKIGGKFEVEGQTGRGTIVRLCVPVG